MAIKKVSKKKVSQKPLAKKTSKKVAKKAGKKVTAARAPSAPSSTHKESRGNLFAAASGVADTSGFEMGEHMEEASSRRVAILGILVVIAVVIFVVIGQGSVISPTSEPVQTETSQPVAEIKQAEAAPAEAAPAAAVEKETKPVADEIRTYTVKSGDTLSKIAREQLGSSKRYLEILKLNNLKDATAAKPGFVLKLPAK